MEKHDSEMNKKIYQQIIKIKESKKFKFFFDKQTLFVLKRKEKNQWTWNRSMQK